MSRILVTGGSGFIGSKVVKKLVNIGHEVVILLREEKESKNIPEKISFQIGDITDIKSLKGSTKDIDIVIHLAGKMEEWNTEASELYNINFIGSKNIFLEALRGKVKHFVFCSTPGVCGIGKNYPVTEDEEYSGWGAYEDSKIKAEEFLIKVSKESKLQLTIVRPDFVYGPGDEQKLPLFKAIKKGKAFIPGQGNALLRPTYIEDAADGIILASLKKQNSFSIYNIGGPEAVSVKLLFDTIAKDLGRRIFHVPIWPQAIFYLIAYILEKVAKPLKTSPLLTRRRLKFFTMSHYTSIEKAKKELGYNPRIGIQEGIRETICWYKNKGLL